MSNQTIDCTPSWSAMLPVLITCLENDDPTGQQVARKELTRMAKLADLYVESQKKPAA